MHSKSLQTHVTLQRNKANFPFSSHWKELPSYTATPVRFSLSLISYLVAAYLLHHNFYGDRWQHALKIIASGEGKILNSRFTGNYFCFWGSCVLLRWILLTVLVPQIIDSSLLSWTPLSTEVLVIQGRFLWVKEMVLVPLAGKHSSASLLFGNSW